MVWTVWWRHVSQTCPARKIILNLRVYTQQTNRNTGNICSLGRGLWEGRISEDFFFLSTTLYLRKTLYGRFSALQTNNVVVVIVIVSVSSSTDKANNGHPTTIARKLTFHLEEVHVFYGVYTRGVVQRQFELGRHPGSQLHFFVKVDVRQWHPVYQAWGHLQINKWFYIKPMAKGIIFFKKVLRPFIRACTPFRKHDKQPTTLAKTTVDCLSVCLSDCKHHT